MVSYKHTAEERVGGLSQDQGGLAPVGGEAREAPLFGAVVGRVTGQIRGGRFEVPALSDCAYTVCLSLCLLAPCFMACHHLFFL